MRHLPISAITIAPNRQREDFDDEAQAELIESIEKLGLLSPIIIRQDDATGEIVLVAGERRLRSVSLLHTLGKPISHAGAPIPPGNIPILHFGELTLLQQQEIEYAENAYRKDLTWQENVRALEKLHALRQAQSSEHSINDTAREIFGRSDGAFRDTVRTSLIIAQHISNPAVAKASSLREATKIIRRIEETARHKHLATLVGTQSISDRIQCLQIDALSYLKDCSNETFDVILTDPPYGMEAESFGDAAGRMAGVEHDYEDGRQPTLDLLARCIPEWYRVAKEQAHLYLWCDIDMFLELRTLCRAAGWWTFRTPLVNFKSEGGRVPWPEHGPRRAYELCLYAVKGKRPVTSIRNDVFESRLSEGNFGHGAQKPVEAYVDSLKRSVRPGDRVLDSFAGTGTIFAAGWELGLSIVGTEINPTAYGICLSRIADLK